MKLCQCEPFQSCPLCPKSKIQKPGKKKQERPVTKSLYIHKIDKPKDLSCKNCDLETGTENYHHAESKRIKYLDGGGIMGGKINDRLTAWLCKDCGYEFDTRPGDKAEQCLIDQHDLFSYDCIAKTHLVREA